MSEKQNIVVARCYRSPWGRPDQVIGRFDSEGNLLVNNITEFALMPDGLQLKRVPEDDLRSCGHPMSMDMLRIQIKQNNREILPEQTAFGAPNFSAITAEHVAHQGIKELQEQFSAFGYGVSQIHWHTTSSTTESRKENFSRPYEVFVVFSILEAFIGEDHWYGCEMRLDFDEKDWNIQYAIVSNGKITTTYNHAKLGGWAKASSIQVSAIEPSETETDRLIGETIQIMARTEKAIRLSPRDTSRVKASSIQVSAIEPSETETDRLIGETVQVLARLDKAIRLSPRDTTMTTERLRRALAESGWPNHDPDYYLPCQIGYVLADWKDEKDWQIDWQKLHDAVIAIYQELMDMS